MEKLPEKLPTNLEEVRNLIEVRFSAMKEIDIDMEKLRKRKLEIKLEVSQLQNVGKKLLFITPKKIKEEKEIDSKTGEKINNE